MDLRVENQRLTGEVKRLENELQLQREELEFAMMAEENNKRAMEEFALVIKEVAAEANQAKEKLASSEEQAELLKEETATLRALVNSKEEENETLNNTIDRLRVEAEESLLACSGKEIEFVKLIKEEEDEKASVLEENRKLFEALTELGDKSESLREETEKIASVFQDALEEAQEAREAVEEAKAEILRLKASLAEKERAVAFLTQETERLRVYEDAAHHNSRERRRVSSCKETKSVGQHNSKLAPESESAAAAAGVELEDPCSSKNEADEEQRKPSKDEPKPNGPEEQKEKRLLPSFSRRSLLPSFSRKDLKSSSHAVDDKELRKLKKEGLVADKHSKSYGAFFFVPNVNAIIPLPGMTSRSKEVVGPVAIGGDVSDGDDAITDSIFDAVDPSSSPPSSLHSRKHRRTSSAINDDKSGSLEEFDHEDLSPHFDDMEVERAGSHSTKKKVLLWRFGDLLRRKNHHPHQNPTQLQTQPQPPTQNFNHNEELPTL